MPKRSRLCGAVVILLGLSCWTGCPRPPEPAPFVPMHEAISHVNKNNIRLTAPGATLFGSPVSASGQLVREPGGGPIRFSLRGSFRFRRPRDFVLVLRDGVTNQEILQAGANRESFWLLIRPEVNTIWWGKFVDEWEPAASERADEERVPFRPDHLLEVLGVGLLPIDTRGINGPVYRPEPERNVLLYLAYDTLEQAYIQKELHLDRYAPFLVRNVLFRYPDSRIQMTADLDDYRPVTDASAQAAHHVRIDWPESESWLDLRMQRLVVEADNEFAPVNPLEFGREALGVKHVVRLADVCTSLAPTSLAPTSRPAEQPSEAPATQTAPATQPVETTQP